MGNCSISNKQPPVDGRSRRRAKALATGRGHRGQTWQHLLPFHRRSRPRAFGCVAFKLGPFDVSLVVPLDDSLPPRKRLAALIATRASIYQDSALLALPVGIRASVKRVLQDRDDVAVADRSPIKAHHRLVVRGAGGNDIGVLSTRTQCLSGRTAVTVTELSEPITESRRKIH